MVAQSTTEAEYITLSNVLCNAIPIMELVKEMKSCKFDVVSILPYVYCKAFKDNSGALDLVCHIKMSSRTKYIVVYYHYLGSMSVQAKPRHIQLIPKINLLTFQLRHLLKICLCNITIRYGESN